MANILKQMSMRPVVWWLLCFTLTANMIAARLVDHGGEVQLTQSNLRPMIRRMRSRVVRSLPATQSPLVLRLLEEREDTLLAPKHGSHDVRLEHSYQHYDINTNVPGTPTEEHLDTEVADPKYSYVYEVQGEEGSGDYGHTEMRDGAKTWGRYFVHQPDGRVKTVRYWADDSGYHAEVDYNGEGAAAEGDKEAE